MREREENRQTRSTGSELDKVWQNQFHAIAELLPDSSLVTLEGPPIYLNEPWNEEHEFGYNVILPALYHVLTAKAQEIRIAALLDDYTCAREYPDSEYIERMRLRPSGVAHESEYEEAAKAELQRFKGQKGKLLYQQGGIYLQEGPRTVALVQTRSGRPACALLDASFQQSKGPGWHILVHPKKYRHQQEEMHAVSKVLPDKPHPFHLVTIISKGNNFSGMVHTDTHGRTKQS